MKILKTVLCFCLFSAVVGNSRSIWQIPHTPNFISGGPPLPPIFAKLLKNFVQKMRTTTESSPNPYAVQQLDDINRIEAKNDLMTDINNQLQKQNELEETKNEETGIRFVGYGITIIGSRDAESTAAFQNQLEDPSEEPFFLNRNKRDLSAKSDAFDENNNEHVQRAYRSSGRRRNHHRRSKKGHSSESSSSSESHEGRHHRRRGRQAPVAELKRFRRKYVDVNAASDEDTAQNNTMDKDGRGLFKGLKGLLGGVLGTNMDGSGLSGLLIGGSPKPVMYAIGVTGGNYPTNVEAADTPQTTLVQTLALNAQQDRLRRIEAGEKVAEVSTVEGTKVEFKDMAPGTMNKVENGDIVHKLPSSPDYIVLPSTGGMTRMTLTEVLAKYGPKEVTYMKVDVDPNAAAEGGLLTNVGKLVGGILGGVGKILS